MLFHFSSHIEGYGFHRTDRVSGSCWHLLRFREPVAFIKPVELFCDIPESVLILYQFLRDIHPAEMIGNLGEQTSIHLDPKQPTPERKR